MSEEVMIPKSYHDKVCEEIIRFKDKQFYDAVHLLDDGTLEITVGDYTKVKRVLVEDGNNWGGLFYEDDVERPKGKWLLSDLQSQADNDNGNYSYVCTNCNHTDIHAKTQKVPYCWWCGARMKGADNE